VIFRDERSDSFEKFVVDDCGVDAPLLFAIGGSLHDQTRLSDHMGYFGINADNPVAFNALTHVFVVHLAVWTDCCGPDQRE
jgi:hypothetical protein